MPHPSPCCLPILLLAAARAMAGDAVDGLKPGCWLEVPNSALASAAPAGVRPNVIAPWSGGAFDSTRDQLIVWGGGHGDYSGNEIYAFSLKTLAWTRVNEPSNPPAKDVAYAADGGPCSRHTYNYLQYLPAIDRFVSLGGAGFWQSGQTGTDHLDAFDFKTRKWSQLKPVPARAFGIGAFSAVDAATGHVWQHGAGGKCLILAEYAPEKDAWTTHGGQWTEGDNDFSYYLTAAIDAKRRLMYACGGGALWSWKLAPSGDIKAEAVAIAGDAEIVKAPSPGFEYHAASDRFIAWSGGADVFALDPATRVWSRLAPAAGNTVTPSKAAGNGTFGRFRYAPKRDVFVVVNSITENVFIYRLPKDGAPAKAKR